MKNATLTGTFTATGQSSSFTPGPLAPQVARIGASIGFNMCLWGTFVGTLQLERSFDGGTTWLPLTALGTPIPFTVPCTETFQEPEEGVAYRLNCTAYTSGTVNYRLSN